MKKFLAFFTLTLLVFSFTSVSASAYYLGDATYEDVATYINHYPINSFNFNGMSLVCAEALVNYGFDVVWNEYENTLHISRNPQKNEIFTQSAFLPTENIIGHTRLAITTSDVKVFCNDYPIDSYGGIEGCTLINIESLTLIDNISAAWHPEVRALKIWIEDGLESMYEPWPLKRLDFEQFYYYTCNDCEGGVDYLWSFASNSVAFNLSLGAVCRADGLCISCDGTLRIVDVIDANGNSRKPAGASYVWGAEEVFASPSTDAYFVGVTDLYFTQLIMFNTDDLLPNTAWSHAGRVDFEYTCHCTGDTYYDSVWVDVLPYE